MPIESRMNLVDQNFGVSFSKKIVAASQLAIFNAAIDKIKKNGTAKKILVRYEVLLAK